MAFADGQFKAGNYASALIEYQRAIFLAAIPRAKYFIGWPTAHFNSGNTTRLLSITTGPILHTQTTSLRINSLLDKTKCNLATKNYNIALIDLLGITDSLPEKTYRIKQFYTGICYFGNEQFDDARHYFTDAVHPSFTQQRKAID
ncbi:MAG: hypothetical protein HC830_14875, partial [Bacteroidetes bacterium]|nr:hypothetical protein [Bacteroidota bacterium]